MKLIFSISSCPIATLEINPRTKTITPLELSNDPLALSPIILPSDRSWTGLEKRLQEMTGNKKSLMEQLEAIQEHELCVPFQKNLKLSIEANE